MPESDSPSPPLRREAWRWYATYLRPRRGMLFLALLPSGLVALFTLPALWLLRYAIDVAIPAGNVRLLLVAGLGIFLCRAASAIVMLWFGRRSVPVIRAIAAAMRCDLVGRLHRLRWIDRSAITDAQANGRIINETERVENLTQSLFYSVVPMLLPLIVYTGVLFVISFWLALIFLVTAPLLRVATRTASRRLRSSIQEFQQSYEQFSTGTQTIVQMLAVARMQGTEAHQNQSYTQTLELLQDSGSKMTFAGMVNSQTNSLVTALIAAVLLIAGGLGVVNHLVSMGTLAAFILASTQVNSSIASLIGAVPTLMNGDEALIRLAEFRGLGREEEAHGKETPASTKPISFERVSFSFGDRHILSSQSMRIEPSLITAIAAPNGQGKTTILELVAGLYGPDEGQILLGDQDLATIDGPAWRRRIGFVPQHPVFFHGTVRQNICFGREKVDEEALRRAIHLAALEPVLATIPSGLDGRVGDRGHLLSGGERQRIAIARALTHTPDLLVMDEPSNHLDKQVTELLIERLLLAVDRPTILMATHDRQLLARADRVYDLSDGVLRLRMSDGRLSQPMTGTSSTQGVQA